MWWGGSDAGEISPSEAFSNQVDAMNNFAMAFGEIHRQRSWHDGMAAFGMLKTAAGFTNPVARDAVISALSTEYKLGSLPAAVASSIQSASDHPDTGNSSRDLIRGTQAVFFSLAHPDRPAQVYVAALVKKTTGFGATPTFFVATPAEAAEPKSLMAKAQTAYAVVCETRQQQRAALA